MGVPEGLETVTERAAEAAAPVNESREAASNPQQQPDAAPDDAALVDAVQRGEAHAFRQLFDRYHRRAYAVAFGVLKHPQSAQDVVQEAFVKVFRHIHKFHGNSNFYTWLYRIVMNLSIDHLRRQKHFVDYEAGAHAHVEAQLEAHRGVLFGHAGPSSPGKAVLRQELQGRLQRALETLSEHHRAVIVLREVEGMSYEQMAQVLEVPKGTIMSRLFHARRKMQQELAAYLAGAPDSEG
ncbi:MAG: RNA polymerase sigma factor [Polyangiales bacterium]